jgi:polyhydroxyalkanoate synthase
MASDALLSRRPEAPVAGHRFGEPSPLIFHLSAALSAYTFAFLAAPRADGPGFPWAAGLAEEAAGLGSLDQLEVAREISRRLQATIAGIEIWQRHPYRRTLVDPPAIWEAGCTRLLDYGAAPGAGDPSGPPVLVVPSLINRAYVLDLLPERSMLRWLAGQGLRPLLLDWGTPGAGEAGFDLAAYGTERLLPALAVARGLAGGPVPVMGYCMGGTLAVGLAARRPEDVSALVTIGAPWDFTSTSGVAGGCRAAIRAEGAAHADRLIEGLGAAFGLVPVVFLQTVFALVNPMQAALKFRKLARLDPAGAAARHFVALEDWIADGVPMSAGAARDLLVGWQIRNRTARGEWRFLGGPVDPGDVAAPALVVCGERDTIAPPPLATPLGAALPQARTIHPRTGHVGMVLGSAARAQVWRPVAEFIASRI